MWEVEENLFFWSKKGNFMILRSIRIKNSQTKNTMKTSSSRELKTGMEQDQNSHGEELHPDKGLGAT